MSLQFDDQLDTEIAEFGRLEREVGELRREVALLRPLVTEIAVLRAQLGSQELDRKRGAVAETELAVLKARVDDLSKRDPSRTAFAMPSGMEIRYDNRNVQRPRLIDTGSFSLISCHTSLLCMKLRPRSKRAKFASISK